MAAKVKTENGSAAIPAAPPAIWSAFARQGAFKSWVIVALLALLGMSILVNMKLLQRPPEYVVVESGSGQTTYVRRSVATDALLKFLREKTQVPDFAVVRFTRDFAELAFGVNSSTIDVNWKRALAMMTPQMRGRVGKEAEQGKLLETYRAAQVRTDLELEDILLVSRTPSLLQVKVTMTRRKSPLVGASGIVATDRLAADLVLEAVTPAPDNPDGLAVAEWSIQQLQMARGEAGRVARVGEETKR